MLYKLIIVLLSKLNSFPATMLWPIITMADGDEVPAAGGNKKKKKKKNSGTYVYLVNVIPISFVTYIGKTFC